MGLKKRTEEPKLPLWRNLLGTALVLSFWVPIVSVLFYACSDVPDFKGFGATDAACQYSYDHGGPGC